MANYPLSMGYNPGDVSEDRVSPLVTGIPTYGACYHSSYPSYSITRSGFHNYGNQDIVIVVHSFVSNTY